MHEKNSPPWRPFSKYYRYYLVSCSRVGFNSKEDMDSDNSLVGGAVCGIKDEVVIDKTRKNIRMKNGSIAKIPVCSLSRKRRSSTCSTALILGPLGGIFKLKFFQ